MFTEQEVTYLKSQHLARIATVSEDQQPDVTPVGFEFDGTFFYVGGRNATQTRKYHNVKTGNSKVALVVDDLASVHPWNPRGIERRTSSKGKGMLALGFTCELSLKSHGAGISRIPRCVKCSILIPMK
jgi:PPOX class F420-dependent enzyme/OxyR family protein